MIPRRFFWILDVLTVSFAFIDAYWLVPIVQKRLIAAGFSVAGLMPSLAPEPDWSIEPVSTLLWILLVSAAPTILYLEITGNYGKWVHQSLTRTILCGMTAPFMGLGLVSVVIFTLKSPSMRISRTFIFLFVLLSGVGLTAYRLALRTYFRRRQRAGYYARNVLLIGLPGGVEWMTRYFCQNVPPAEYRLVGYLRIATESQDRIFPSEMSTSDALSVRPVPEIGNVRELGDLLIHRPIDEVVAIQPASGGEWIAKVIEDCDHLGILLRIVPEALILGGTQRLRMLFPFQQLNLPAVVLKPPHADSDAIFIKRLVDVALSAALMVLLAPVFLIIAIAIRLTSPDLPIFYRWRVVGRNGVEFTGFKFTTMVADAEERRNELLERNEMSGPVFKIKDDPRMTRLGSFLRKYSLNELPQLWSVLKGDMSLVGPRPAFRHELERYEFWHKRKLSIKPGITCLWQIRGRNRINNFDEWVRMDLEYIDNWSLWLDFKILLLTGWVVLKGSGA